MQLGGGWVEGTGLFTRGWIRLRLRDRHRSAGVESPQVEGLPQRESQRMKNETVCGGGRMGDGLTVDEEED